MHWMTSLAQLSSCHMTGTFINRIATKVIDISATGAVEYLGIMITSLRKN